MKLTKEQVLTISKGDQEIADFITGLLVIIDQQAKRIKQLEARVHELERQLGQNSNNSSKPPTSDGLRKPTHLRQAGGKKGAPKGHPGHTLRFCSKPDEVVTHTLEACSRCASLLTTTTYETRQVFDLPAPRVRVTEHRAQLACCSACGLEQRADFPAHVKAPTQYGDGFTAWTAYLHAYQMLPLERIAALFEDLTGLRPSEATLLSMLGRMHRQLEQAEQDIRKILFQKPLVHADETGVRVKEKLHWMHTVCTSDYTWLAIHDRRGSKGMNALGQLPFYLGTVVHDCFTSYFVNEYRFTHALCNAHLLRECKGIAEHDRHQWAASMMELLQESWQLAREYRQWEKPIPAEVVDAICSHYDEILKDAPYEWAKISKGKTKSKSENLAVRLAKYKPEILRFLWDAHTPFDNNQAERELRMVKVKQKISGCFRTLEGATQFARMRSVISTLIKQKLAVLPALVSSLSGQLRFG
ncbi:IS66 family transposase [Paenibacillus sp. SYP-B4298]|uniref:IS66 family transposase n=1 Tax=Paenibacillus sp. SYP-B4298 TaxID=2996034 RepID=UPI0022DDCCC7|nr:IS66 family transposase [Paenibacillus sp. SYP-B4298]